MNPVAERWREAGGWRGVAEGALDWVRGCAPLWRFTKAAARCGPTDTHVYPSTLGSRVMKKKITTDYGPGKKIDLVTSEETSVKETSISFPHPFAENIFLANFDRDSVGISVGPPHGEVRPFHHKSNCFSQLTLGPNVVQMWSRNTLDLRGNQAFVLQRVAS